jgi:hypothetical protein
MQRYQLPTNDYFQEAFEDFQQSALFDRLQKKFMPLPYYKKFKPLRLVALIASYAFNIFSAVTAATLVFFFTLKVTQSVFFSGAITVIFIVLLEITKRITAGHLFKNKLQFGKIYLHSFLMVAILICLSVLFSFYGSQKAVHTFTPPPDLILLDTLTAYQTNQIVLLDEQIEQARKTTYKGTTTRTSQRTIENLTNQKNALIAQKIALENDAIKSNKVVQEQKENQTNLNAFHFALFTLFLEGLFLICAWYLEYYDFRSLSEFAITSVQISNHNIDNGMELSEMGTLARAINDNSTKQELQLNGSQGPPLEEGIILKAIKNVKNKISTAKYRLRNSIGSKETSEKNLVEAQDELEELNLKLKLAKS